MLSLKMIIKNSTTKWSTGRYSSSSAPFGARTLVVKSRNYSQHRKKFQDLRLSHFDNIRIDSHHEKSPIIPKNSFIQNRLLKLLFTLDHYTKPLCREIATSSIHQFSKDFPSILISIDIPVPN